MVTLMRQQLEKDGRKDISEGEGQRESWRNKWLGVSDGCQGLLESGHLREGTEKLGPLFRGAQNRDCKELQLSVMIRCGV